MIWFFETLSRPLPLKSLVLAAAVCACVAVGWKWQALRRITALQASLERQTMAASDGLAGSDDDRRAPQGDFTTRLPASVPIQDLVRELQRSSATVNVSLASVSASPRVAGAQTLGRTDIAVQLHGSYSNLKAVLAETLNRFPGLALQHLSIRRVAGTSDLEARIELFMATRPLPVSADQGLLR